MPTNFTSGPVRVRVPATSANLGPGFDALGSPWRCTTTWPPRSRRTGVTVAVTGQGAGELPADDRHLVVRAMRAAFDCSAAHPGG